MAGAPSRSTWRRIAPDATGGPRSSSGKAQKAMVEEANLVILFQPVYQVAVRDTVKSFPLTAAGWLADLSGAKS